MKHIFFILAFALFTPLTAQADYYVWKDAHSDIKLTYPDTWAQTSPYEPDTIVRVEAPGTDMAECKIRVREDRRFLVYPQRYRAAIQEMAYSEDFWNDYLASYDNVIMHRLDNGAGLGNAFASLMTASYMSNHPLKGIHKTSIALAGLYRDKAVIYECSARAEAFNNYQNMFQSILNSVEFDKEFHELPTGHNTEMQKGPMVQTRDPSDRYTSQY